MNTCTHIQQTHTKPTINQIMLLILHQTTTTHTYQKHTLRATHIQHKNNIQTISTTTHTHPTNIIIFIIIKHLYMYMYNDTRTTQDDKSTHKNNTNGIHAYINTTNQKQHILVNTQITQRHTHTQNTYIRQQINHNKQNHN